MRARRYTVVVADRSTGVVRRATISLRPFLSAIGFVLILPVLVGLGAKWSARGEIDQLKAANAALELENGSYRLATGELMHRGKPVNPKAIRKTALLTVEGERDDICAIGQTMAAHDLCTGIKPYMKRHHLQAGVGHYGVFSGKRWNKQIYPIVKNTILAME